jgi:hypothetical protein
MDLLSEFPHFENAKLFYEYNVHKIVHYDVVLAIPQGEKCFAWFSKTQGYLVDLNKTSATPFQSSPVTDDILFSGTFVRPYFYVEDVLHFRGKPMNHIPFLEKLELLRDLFSSELPPLALSSNHLIFGVPLMAKWTDQRLPSCDYPVAEWVFRSFANNKICRYKAAKMESKESKDPIKPKEQKKKTAVFKVVADIEPDIYHLHTLNDTYVDVALVPTFRQSVFMNHLFRKIKENRNLDAIEESDDEDEFEDQREDKFVHLDRSYTMRCEWNAKFKRWVPVSVV